MGKEPKIKVSARVGEELNDVFDSKLFRQWYYDDDASIESVLKEAEAEPVVDGSYGIESYEDYVSDWEEKRSVRRERMAAILA